MKQPLAHIIAFVGLVLCLSSCHTSAPRLDYKALAQASVRLGVDIELTDNHRLYINAAEWIGTPTGRAVAANKERTVPAWCPSFTRKPTAYVYRVVPTDN